MTTAPRLAAFGALNGAMAVAIGAFAAHGADASAEALLKTAGHYQMVHGLLAVTCAVWPGATGLAKTAGWLAAIGGLVFSAALTAIALLDLTIMGAVAPLGGLLMILGWLTVAFAALRSPTVNI
ncbi:MAG TPA: DUF423 domain-containing protein [Brevundimonas sp.]|nr:DUF423 domain-containing protein [Brevundimonas sp.]